MDTTLHNRTFDGNGIIWAVIASILLHIFLVVFLPNFDFSQPEEKRQVLKIELQQPKPSAPTPMIEPLPPIEIPEPPKPKPVKKKPKPIIKPKPIKKEIPAPIEEPEFTPPPVVENVIAVEPTVDSKAETVIPQPPPPMEPPPPPKPTQADIDNALSAYGTLLGRAIAKHKSYPKIAQRRGWQGTVLLDLKLDSNGNIVSATIRESSGYDALDKNALKMAEKAAPFPAPPKALQGRTFNITVPVSFKLANG